MGSKADVWQGTLALMILRTLDTLGPQHGYGIARRIGQISGDALSVNYGTLHPALLKLEQEGAIASEWGHWRTAAARSSMAHTPPAAPRWAARFTRLGPDDGDHGEVPGRRR